MRRGRIVIPHLIPSNIGVNKNQSSRWQQLASIPEGNLEIFHAIKTGAEAPVSVSELPLIKLGSEISKAGVVTVTTPRLSLAPAYVLSFIFTNCSTPPSIP